MSVPRRFLLNDFVSEAERVKIINLCLTEPERIPASSNVHVDTLNKKINGHSALYDISKTDLSSLLAAKQGGFTLTTDIDPIYLHLHDEIVLAVGINDYHHSFMQTILVGPDGVVAPHYDMAIPGYVTYKCNVVICGEHDIHVKDEIIPVVEGDLYCFEASLYKHWIDPRPEVRIMLSYGFIVPYTALDRNVDDPRARMSRRIWSYMT